MERLPSPRRILALGPSTTNTTLLQVLTDLTGSAPTPHTLPLPASQSETEDPPSTIDPTSSSTPLPPSTSSPPKQEISTAGLSHTLPLTTPYFTAEIPVWIDEFPPHGFSEWKEEFLKDEAGEVVSALGGILYIFETRDGGEVGEEVEGVLKGVKEVVEKHLGMEGGEEGEVVLLAVGVPMRNGEKGVGKGMGEDALGNWEDVCLQYGFEFVDYGGTGRNVFGERQGLERVREALEAGEWSGGVGEEDLDLDDLDFDAEPGELGERGEFNSELWGLKAALLNHRNAQMYEEDGEEGGEEEEGGKGTGYFGDEEQQVETLDRLMGKLMSVKESMGDLSEGQKRRMAAEAVREMMRNHPDI